MNMKNFTEFSAELDEASNDYFKRRKDEEGRIAGTKAPAKRTPKQTDYEKKRKEQKVTESAICVQCESDPCICDDSHGFVSEAIDKEHPIVKEYDSLKKNHDIKSLRGLIKGQHRIVDTSEYKTKDHAISAYLRHKHGDKKVDKAFGFNKEEVELDEAHKIGSQVEVIKGSGKGIKGHIGEIRHGAYKGAPKTYTVFHGDKGAIQVGKEHIRAIKEEVELDEAAQGHTIEAHGIRGMKGTAWRKTFKSHKHLSDWADKNDSVEVHATRDLDQAKKGNISPAMKEAVLSFNDFVNNSITEQATWYSKEKFTADAEKKHGKITRTSRDKDGRTHYHIASGQTSGMSETDGEGSTSYTVHTKPHTAK
jgi:hypothetical protein